jgi:hypothetical protein
LKETGKFLKKSVCRAGFRRRRAVIKDRVIRRWICRQGN